MEQLIENFRNGNLKDAKRQARRVKIWDLREALVDYGYSERKAVVVSDYLKGRDNWAAVCAKP